MASSGAGPPDSQPPLMERNQQYQKIRLSPEEHRVLRECNRESFYYRCLPLGIVAMTATHLAVKSGYLKPNVKWGSTFKVLGAGFVSYVLGKYSYQKECAEKLMQLSNSQIGEALRSKYGRSLHEGPDFDHSLHSGPDTSLHSLSEYSTTASSDSDQNVQHQGLDDTFRPTVDSPTVPLADEPLPTQHTTTTYDELRQKNRDEYQGKRHEAISRRPDLFPSQAQPPAPPARPPSSDDTQSRRKVKNKYGDVWED